MPGEKSNIKELVSTESSTVTLSDGSREWNKSTKGAKTLSPFLGTIMS